MDQGVIRSLNVQYRKRVVVKKMREIDANATYTINVLDALHILKCAWDDVKKSTIMNCFRRAGLTLNTEDGMMSDEDDPDEAFR